MNIDFTAIFKTQVESHIKAITDLVLEMEQQDAELGQGSALIEALMREFHTIKGAARAVEYIEIKDCAHRLEDIYHDLLDGKEQAKMPILIDLTLYAIDLINEMLSARISSQEILSVDEFDQLVEDYKNDKVDEIIRVPYNKTFSSILSIIPLQIISYFLSGIRGLNCDKPVNLAKCVTTD